MVGFFFDGSIGGKSQTASTRPTEPNRLHFRQKTMARSNPQKEPAASTAASQTSGLRALPNQSCQHSSPIPKQMQNAKRAQGNPDATRPKPPHASNPITAYSAK